MLQGNSRFPATGKEGFMSTFSSPDYVPADNSSFEQRMLQAAEAVSPAENEAEEALRDLGHCMDGLRCCCSAMETVIPEIVKACTLSSSAAVRILRDSANPETRQKYIDEDGDGISDYASFNLGCFEHAVGLLDFCLDEISQQAGRISDLAETLENAYEIAYEWIDDLRNRMEYLINDLPIFAHSPAIPLSEYIPDRA